MAEAINATVAADERATAAARSLAAAQQGLASSTNGVSKDFGDFYDTSQRDFADVYNRQMAGVISTHGKAGKAAGLHAHELLNLTRQFSDLGVTAAMGMNPLMILIQQGPQIADIFQQASMRGVGFKDALKSIGSSVGPVLAIGGPLLAIAGGVRRRGEGRL